MRSKRSNARASILGGDLARPDAGRARDRHRAQPRAASGRGSIRRRSAMASRIRRPAARIDARDAVLAHPLGRGALCAAVRAADAAAPAPAFERIGGRFSLPGAGVHIVEATKQLYRPAGLRRAVRRALPPMDEVLAPVGAGAGRNGVRRTEDGSASAARPKVDRQAEAPREEQPAMQQAGIVYAMVEAGREMPLRRNFGLGQRIGRKQQRIRRDHRILLAMDEQHRRRFGPELRWNIRRLGPVTNIPE